MTSPAVDLTQRAPLLTVQDLRITFETAGAEAAAAVQGVSFSLEPGQTLGLVGESGSGKSVTSFALLRLLPPAARVAGRILFRGQDLLTLPEKAMRSYRGREIAMIFQEPMTALNPVMPIGEQIAEAVRAHHPRLQRSEIRERVVEALHEVALPDPARRLADYPHQFSGGQRQRILIAMAVVNRPALLIADEPTTALDVTVQAQILKLLRKLREQHNLAMLFISHDLAVTAEVADRTAVMRHGQILEENATAELFRYPQHAYTRQLMLAAPTMQTDRSRPLATLV